MSDISFVLLMSGFVFGAFSILGGGGGGWGEVSDLIFHSLWRQVLSSILFVSSFRLSIRRVSDVSDVLS